MRSEALICAAEFETVHSFFKVNRMIILHNLCNHRMQIIKLPRLLHTVIAEPVEAHNTDFRFIERIAVIGNTVQQRIKLLFRAVPVKRFRKFNQNCVTAALKNKIKYSVILPFCVLRDVKRQFLYAFGQLFLQCKFIKL